MEFKVDNLVNKINRMKTLYAGILENGFPQNSL